MKNLRPLAAALLAFALGLSAAAQESGEVASLRAKAVKGNGIAQYNLGLAYAQGRGIAADQIEAFVWLSLAGENGARGRALDSVIASLDKTSLETAQKRLAERKATLGVRAAPATSVPARAETAPETVTRPTPATPAAPAAAVPAPAQPGDDAGIAAMRAERDALAARINSLSGDLADLRADRDRLAKLAADNDRAAKAAEARVTEIGRAGETTKAELARTKQALATLEQAPKPAADTTALDAKNRELQAALADLESARTFGRQVEDTLNKVNDDRAKVAAAAAAELQAARDFGRQVEDTLNGDRVLALKTIRQESRITAEAQLRFKEEFRAMAKLKHPNTVEVFEYGQLVSEHIGMQSDSYGSVFYFATGFHGLHVTGGLIAFLLVIGRVFAVKTFTHKEATSAIVVSYYWHFVDVVWIGLFLVIYVLK